MRRTASRSGATTSGRTTASSGSCGPFYLEYRLWPSRRRRRKPARVICASPSRSSPLRMLIEPLQIDLIYGSACATSRTARPFPSGVLFVPSRCRRLLRIYVRRVVGVARGRFPSEVRLLALTSAPETPSTRHAQRRSDAIATIERARVVRHQRDTSHRRTSATPSSTSCAEGPASAVLFIV